MRIRPLIILPLVTLASGVSANAQLLISGYMANPASTDSPYEYVQLVATKDINFANTPMSVVFANNGTATTSGWVAGGSLTYQIALNSGSVTAGQVFYVGGSGELINGAGSTSLSTLNWLAAVNTATTAGYSFGSAASAGVMGNGGSNADAIGIFNSISLTAASTPIDAIFYGSAVGSAVVSSGSAGYTLPVNDLYSGGYLQSSSTIMLDPASGAFTSLTGTYDTNTLSWTIARTSSAVASPTTLAQINSQITLGGSGVTPTPEPSALAFGAMGLATLVGLHRYRKA